MSCLQRGSATSEESRVDTKPSLLASPILTTPFLLIGDAKQYNEGATSTQAHLPGNGLFETKVGGCGATPPTIDIDSFGPTSEVGPGYHGC
jgi:hypothetical protein